MITGVGCDIVNHELTGLLDWGNDVGVLARCFSQTEIDQYLANPSIKFLSGRFAAKEAVLKCMGIGMTDGISLTEIETCSGDLGQPQVILYGQAKNISEKKGISNFHLSISHSSGYSIAIVVAESFES